MQLDLKSKLLFLTAVPIIIIFILSIGRIIYDIDVKQELEDTKEHIVEARALSRVIHTMQIERGLSIGFVTKGDSNDTESLAKARENLNRAIEATNSIYFFKKIKNIDFSNISNDLTSIRNKVDNFDISTKGVMKYYTKHIESLIDFTQSMPSMISDRDDRNFIQAYSYILASKESLGQIRAALNEALIMKTFSDANFMFVSEQLYNYKNNLNRFEKTLFDHNELIDYYYKNLNDASTKETFKIINSALKNKDTLDLDVNASHWFEHATMTIDMLKEVESKLFQILYISINEKISAITFTMTFILFFLLFMIAIVIFFSATSIKKIISLTNKFSEDFEDSLTLLEQYKATVDKSFIVSKTDPKGIITYANETFCKISGYTEAELVGKPHNIIRHPDMPKDIFQEMWHTIKELKQPWSGEIKNLAKDGSSYWMNTHINPILDKEGNVIEHIAMRMDITMIQEDKERIKESLGISMSNYEEARHLANEYEDAMNATWSIIRTDTDNIIIHINETFSKVSGYSLKELVGRNCSELRDKKHINSGDCDRLKAALWRKEIFRMQFENIAKDGSSYFVDATVIPIVNSKGVVIEHLHLMCNVTELVQLHVEIEKTQQEIICRMGEISESRSKETGKHIHRVSEYSRLLALKAGFDEKEANLIANASPMHDIGKVAIPDKVLLKPGKLDEEEWEIMRSHSTIGHTVLSGSQRPLLNAAAVIAKEHHEKYNGSGYPDGIVGEDIHIYARIVAIADVFDALGTDRVYKKGWELDKILNFFEEEKGKHFDSKLATIFLENIDEFLKIRDEYKEVIK
ncbi:nitrate- and nitrite sensing domain-containing protein [Sulfurimonas sp.]|uniref:nitrate- and nitrite sensing domain-containing protein n=1 Tax=Sulfurimonas sp. TaxID=2022749 RepID=UPI0035671FDB